LHNVAKHASATTVTIDLKQEGDLVKLVVEDDGVGISPKSKAARQTFGMTGMRERMANVGGKMRVTSTRGKGTRIEVSAPVPNHALSVEQGLTSGRSGAAAWGA